MAAPSPVSRHKPDITSLYKATLRVETPIRPQETPASPAHIERKRSNSIVSSETVCSEVKSNERYFITTMRSLEKDNAYLQVQIDREMSEKLELSRELSHLKTTNSLQDFKIEQLLIELRSLKMREFRVTTNENERREQRHERREHRPESPLTPSPPSILKSSSSSPRRNRISICPEGEDVDFRVDGGLNRDERSPRSECIFLKRVE
mmetsp:Transcript_29561/g.52808  ORF Transcript_29561/g.52808 Transcript_29561/m.52808 type:complete len:207 (-) Transcript_29561:132-752(-)